MHRGQGRKHLWNSRDASGLIELTKKTERSGFTVVCSSLSVAFSTHRIPGAAWLHQAAG